MALTDDYEPVRASLLHQNPLPSLEDALHRLKSEETRLCLTRSKFENAFAVPDKRPKFCRHCNRSGHLFLECPNIECRKCKQKGHIATNCSAQFCYYCKKPVHLINACPTRPPRPDLNKTHSHSKFVPVTAAVTNASSSSSSVPPSPILTSDVESFLKQLLSLSGNNSPALSVTPGAGSSDETDYRDWL
ncbi:hypothetical protein PIB30_027143 [Stylosanthes scabra]|uniref:CCHC-type domain-containing protein n=1 Tax=Stylosanthes scabra TaxID=79078 RepID=A0ABU6YAR7_9FABA|nr:hypothetical protein [Stylosanthes scabra]